MRRKGRFQLKIGRSPQQSHGRYLPFSLPGGQLLFHLISKLYENTSLLITTNLAFADWPQPSDEFIGIMRFRQGRAL